MVWPATSSIDRLLAEPQRFGFFQALRLLERWLGGAASGRDDVLATKLRIHNSLSLAFPASEIAEFSAVARDGGTLDAREPGDIERVDITPAFIGLLGASGTLPAFYTELFAAREHQQRDGAGRAFLDVFLQRSVTLLYEAWRKHRLALHYEADRRRHYLPMVLSLTGLGQHALRDRLRPSEGGVSDDTLAFYAGVLRQRPMSAPVLRRILSQYFGVPVTIDSFVGRWFALPDDHQTSLGVAHGTLGAGAVVGQRVWQRDLRLRITLGPMPRPRFLRFLPGGPGALALKELLTLVCGLTLEHEIRLSLRAQDVQPARLDAQQAPRLGWDGFLVTQPAERDRCDAGYDLLAA